MSDVYFHQFKCFRCGITDFRKSGIQLSLVYPSGRKESVLVCYSCFRLVQNHTPFLIKEGHGRYVQLEIPQEVI